MARKEFRITIDAPREKVWQVLWDLQTYPVWTAPFSPSSNVRTDNWKKDSKVLFTDGSGNGMVSTVAENVPNEFMSFRHLGELKDGVEDTSSERVSAWAGATENYTLRDNGGKTELVIDMDITEEFADMFDEMWPKALDKVKELSEK